MTNDLLEMPPRTSLFKEEVRPEGPGSRLRRAREARRLTIEDVAKRLRYAPSRVEQLESDDYHAMGAPTFARGYLRSYAGQLNFSKDEILEILRAFDQLELGAAISGHKPQLIREEVKQVNPKLARRIGYGVAALVVVLAATWWLTSHFKAAGVKPVEGASAAAATTAADATTATSGQVQLEVVPLDGQGPAAGNAATTDTTTSNAVSLPLPNLQPNRVSPTSRAPVQTPTQSTPQATTTTTTTTPSTTTATTKSTTKPTTLKNVPAPVVAKPTGD